jgi:hypothetical protein
MDIIAVVMYTPVAIAAGLLVFHIITKDPGSGWP